MYFIILEHNNFIGKLSNLSKFSECQKYHIEFLLDEFHISINYQNDLILVFFVVEKNYYGVRMCLELGSNPTTIMKNDLIMKMDKVNKLTFDGLFRSFKYECDWIEIDSNETDNKNDKLNNVTDSISDFDTNKINKSSNVGNKNSNHDMNKSKNAKRYLKKKYPDIKFYSRYSGCTPKQAASKTFSTLIKRRKMNLGIIKAETKLNDAENKDSDSEIDNPNNKENVDSDSDIDKPNNNKENVNSDSDINKPRNKENVDSDSDINKPNNKENVDSDSDIDNPSNKNNVDSDIDNPSNKKNVDSDIDNPSNKKNVDSDIDKPNNKENVDSDSDINNPNNKNNIKSNLYKPNVATRYFKVMDSDNNFCGRYTGRTPKQAASKAFSSLIKMKKMNQGTYMEGGELQNQCIILRECTKGSKKKIYKYNVSRTQLDNPVFIKIGQNMIKYQYRNRIVKFPNES